MKNKILDELKNGKGIYLSGEDLSKKFHVSRTAIWKNIKKLKEEGYIIKSVTNKGYVLLESPDILYPHEIREQLNTNFIGKEIICLESVDSTNSYAKRLAENDFSEGTVIIAEEQTAGRGRLGRNWVAPKGKGIWMTILLKPDTKPEQASLITLIAAVAVLDGIAEECGLDIKIKWPNDLVLNGKKVCGILTEMSAEIDRINYLCVGIGINVNLDKEDFEGHEMNNAASLKIASGSVIERKKLIAYILAAFEVYYSDLLKSGNIDFIIDKYKKASVNVGKEVRLITKGEEIIAKAEDINKAGHLIVRLKDGSFKEISSGEVSVRGIYGYI